MLLQVIVILSFGVSYLLGNFETIILWFFIGCIVGTIPALWKEAGKEGRSTRDIIILLASFIGGCVLLYLGENAIGGSVEANFFTWMIAGGLIALGIIVPGLSPSNFIVYMGMYKQMSDGFKNIRHERDSSNRIRWTCNISALLKTCTLHFQESLPTIIPLHFRNRACFNCNDHPNKLRWI